ASSRGGSPAAPRGERGGSVVLGLVIDARLGTLLRRDGGRGRGERVVAVARLGEGDDLADRVGLRQQLQHAIPPEGDAAVGRRAEGEGVEQEAELLLRLVL